MDQTPDEPGPTPDELSAASEESVRRLLAEARATGPMPEEVRLRLEEVLGGLADVDHKEAAGTRVPVVDLAARRRRRVRTLFVAAAAVTAFGVALPQLLQISGLDSSSVLSTAEDAPAPAAAEEDTGAADGDSSPAAELDEGGQQDTTAPSAPPNLREDRFAEDAQALRDRGYLTTGGLSGIGELSPDCLAATDRTAEAQSAAIAVRYSGRDAALLLGEPVDGLQRAILYICGESAPRRTTLLAVR
jgi:hypothetical protein